MEEHKDSNTVFVHNKDSSPEKKIYVTDAIQITNLGKSLRLGSKSAVTIHKPGAAVEYFSKSIYLSIGIGNDHMATLTMSEAAFLAFNKGAKIHIDTIQDQIKERTKDIKNGGKR